HAHPPRPLLRPGVAVVADRLHLERAAVEEGAEGLELVGLQAELLPRGLSRIAHGRRLLVLARDECTSPGRRFPQGLTAQFDRGQRRRRASATIISIPARTPR